MTLFFFSLSLAVMILLPLVLAVAWRRRFDTPWWLFCLGILTFGAAQAVHLPVNDLLGRWGVLPTDSVPTGMALVRAALLLGLSAGLFETVARAVGYVFLFRRGAGRQWADGVMVGLGHGGVEAMGFVAVLAASSFSSLWAIRGSDLSALPIPASQAALVAQQLQAMQRTPWLLLLPALERVIAIILHVVLSLLVWTAFQRRNAIYALLALLYHATFDAAAVYVTQSGGSSWAVWGTMLGLSLPGIFWVWRTWPRGVASPSRPSPRVEWTLFAAAVGKELREQWRTRRVLIVAAVFLFFGLGSPLIARFTPEILRSVAGAEQFADLIPQPTTADALGQYIKNLTQFGFIIALLLGMGAVAGEKERGIAPMILSKPLPRWAFVLSKFTAQALVYLAAFLLAGLATAYYTSLLFAPLAFGPFMLGNLLLLVWLLVFAAATLLGSTVANSTGAAAGLGLVLSVGLLVLGSLPIIGPLMPSGLVAWAAQLGLPGTITPNGGALVAGINLIILFLLFAVASFETQEL
ncbi:MAG: YhfC family intramembrane metalloprotease [Ardenticatenales bacterium]|nr:YhfC family intramembrane metalloprotease [Ardenticatenales bacterium]